MNLDEFRALTPWSFFLPVALAVAVGVLVANALGAALFNDDDAIEVAETGTEAVEGGKKAAVEATPAPAAGGVARVATVAEPVVLAPERLPGPSSARRDGETRACIGGTIAVRADNGWEQEVVNDAPARCTASSR
ncbi:MAG: hypothetical protein L0H23_10845 [Luteimonas sp.]|nr:hypothetical protein [Luteimonas sp.]